jgi:hypothetical protein
MRARTALAVTTAALLIAALPLVAQTAPSAASGQANEHMRQMPRPTNLQVLPKDISGRDLIATMRGYSKALGVECGFCHAQDPKTHQFNFASDAKPDKGMARIMIRMKDEINAKYLATINDPDASAADKTVTCGTCHRGHTMPVPFDAAPGAQHHQMPPRPE